MTKKKSIQLPAHETSSGNVFADLGLPNPDDRMLKANIVAEVHRSIQDRGLTQVRAAKLLGISQPDLSHLLRGDFDDYSAERLIKMLTVFEQDVEIVVKPHRRTGETGRITFRPSAI
jgi:predicted XRE-type DNA-binding protein